MQKKYLIILLVVVLVIIILILPRQWGVKKPAPGAANQTATTTDQTTRPFVPVTTVAPTQVPKAMPANLPFETGVQILQNFEITDPATGKTQSTRVYVSKKTIEADYASYQKYLKDNSWTITSGIDQPTIKNLSATKDAARLDITFAKDPNGQVTVNVSYVD